MKIGIVTTWFERGAAYVSRQYRDVLEPDHEVYIYARGGEQYGRGLSEWENQHVHWSKKQYIHLLSDINLREFKKWLVGNKIDLVLFNEQRSWPTVVLCRRLGIKTAAYIDYYKEDQIKYFALYDMLFCNTERHYSVFEGHPGAHYIPWGTDVDLFKPQDETWPERVEAGVVTFFHSAGMSPGRKGTDILLRAFSGVSRENAKLIVHSQVDLATAMPELSETIDSLQKTGRLTCVNETVGAPGLYHLGDVYVYPTRLEGIGLSLLEALSCGLPAIVPDCAPMNEFVPCDSDWGDVVKIKQYVSRSDGYYWPQCFVDVDDLRSKMEWYCDHEAKVPELKRNARAYVESHRDWSCNAKNLAKLMGSCPQRDVPDHLMKKAWSNKRSRLIYDVFDPYFISKLKKGLFR